jgi:hypothetical protein
MRRARQRLLVALALVVAALAPVALGLDGAPPAAAGTSAIQPNNQPTAVPGQSNGEVDPSQLVQVEGTCREARAAAPSLARLLASARGDHVALGTNSCYRARAKQAVLSSNACSSGNCACAGPPGHSMHGWGKAVDLTEDDQPMTSGSTPGFRWLRANAGRFGWNHPGWAEVGGSPCPEMWHWEWVGDGGTMQADQIRADVVALSATPSGAGYRIVTGLGAVSVHGDAADAGNASGIPIAGLIVASAPTPAGKGYWLAGTDGGVFSFGDATFVGSTGSTRLNQPIVAMAAAPDGRGYWLVAGDGGVFSFGSASFFGSTGSTRLNQPIVAMAPTPDGRGYWLFAADGGVFSFGTASFFGSTGAVPLNHAVVGAAPAPDGRGYWLVAADGGVFGFGSASFFGSAASKPLDEPVVGMARTPAGRGYWLVAAGGGVFTFGDAVFTGSG